MKTEFNPHFHGQGSAKFASQNLNGRISRLIIS